MPSRRCLQVRCLAPLLLGMLSAARCQAATPAGSDRPIMVVFRYDDYCELTPTLLETRLISSFRRIGASVTFAAVPFISAYDRLDPSPQPTLPLAPEKGAILRDAVREGVVDLALHGVTHQTTRAGRTSEFTGVDYERQREMIDRGRRHLRELTGVEVTSFVPPWNQYDLTTIRALQDLNFTILSASLRGEAAADTRLRLLPSTCSLANLERAIEAARAMPDRQPVVMALFHDYDFTETPDSMVGFDISAFDALLDRVRSQPDVVICSVAQAVTALDDAGAARYLGNRGLIRPTRILPPFLQSNDRLVYRDDLGARTGLWALAAAFHLPIALLAGLFGFAAGTPVFDRVAWLRRSAMALCATLAGFVAIRVLGDANLYVKGALIFDFALGACVGAGLAYGRARRRRQAGARGDIAPALSSEAGQA